MRSHTSQYDKVPEVLVSLRADRCISVQKTDLFQTIPMNRSKSKIIWDHLGFPKYWKINFSPAEIASAFKGLFLTVPTIINGKNCSARLFTKFFFEEYFLFRIFRSILYGNKSRTFFFFNGFWHLCCLCFRDRQHATFNLASALKSNLFPMTFLYRLTKIR